MTTPSPWFHHWKDVRQGLCAALDKLSDAQLAFVPRTGLWSLGTTAAHIASAEEGWFRYVVQRELGGWPDYAASDYATVERLKALLARVHDRTTAYLETLDEAGLARVVDLPWGGRVSLNWVIWHVLEHEIHHRGEICLMLGLLGMEAPDV